MADTSRKPIHQLIDYRIFVVTCYHKDEMTAELLEMCKSQARLDVQTTPSGNYTFIKYAIDDYVKNFNISRAIEGEPGHLTVSVFPIKNQHMDNYSFMYSRGLIPITTFRRMDYIEVQVAEIHWTDDEASSRAKEISDFKAMLNDPARSMTRDAYKSEKYSQLYQVRFRGFVNEVNESDSAEQGMEITLRAASMLSYLANTPFITNLSMFSSTYYETQRSHILPGQFLVLYGDLLQDLRDTVTRTRIFMEETFKVGSTKTTESAPTTKSKNGSLRSYDNVFYVAATGDTPYSARFTNILKELDNEVTSKTKMTQAALIPLAQIFFARMDSWLGDTPLYKLFQSEVFDTEIQFEGTQAEFISKYTYLLQVLNQFKESVEYILYEQADGTVVFDRPRYAATPSVVIDEDEYISYDFTENTTGYNTEVFTTPGTALQLLDDTIKETFFKTSGYTLDQLRRFGYRRTDPLSNPNIMVESALELYAKTKKAVSNAALTQLSLSLGVHTSVDIARTILFRKKWYVGFVTDITERYEYGGSCMLDLTMSYLRRVLSIPKSIKSKNVTIDNVSAIIIEDFPEYTFVSDFYGARFTSAEQSATQDKKERSVL